MRLAKTFLKSIPKEKIDLVLQKIRHFEQLLFEYEAQIRALPAGFWVRKVSGTEIFKFRLNQKDRVLFKFAENRADCSQSEILFLRYVCHDEQIRRAKALALALAGETEWVDAESVLESITSEISMQSATDTVTMPELEIDLKYSEDTIESSVDAEVCAEFQSYGDRLDEIESIVVDDDFVQQLVKNGEYEMLYYVSDEQHSIITSAGDHLIINGVAGSGKTIVLLNILAAAEKKGLSCLFLSSNGYLVHNTQNIYKTFASTENLPCTTHFRSLRDVLSETAAAHKKQLMTNEECSDWILENLDEIRPLRHRELPEILTQLRSTLKGLVRLTSEGPVLMDGRLLPLTEYLTLENEYSEFAKREKRGCHELAQSYNVWLDNQDAWDEADAVQAALRTPVSTEYDLVIVDEVQNLSEAEQLLIGRMIRPNGRSVWSGDANQSLLPAAFRFNSLHKILQDTNTEPTESYLLRSFRSSQEIAAFLNDVTDIKTDRISKSNYDLAVETLRSGGQLYMLQYGRNDLQRLYQEVQKHHDAAIVVPNDHMRKELLRASSGLKSRVFTVYEICGLEFEQIYGINLLSEYEKNWQKILNSDEKLSESMRYYFNLLYIATTRSRGNVYFYEENPLAQSFAPFRHCAVLSSFDNEELCLVGESTQEEWEQEAVRLEQAGLQKMASSIRIKRDISLENAMLRLHGIEPAGPLPSNEKKKARSAKNFEKDMENGLLYYRNQDYPRARQEFTQLLDQYSDQSELYYYLANSCAYAYGLDEYSNQFFAKAIELDDSKVEYYIDWASAMTPSNNFGTAHKIMEFAAKKFPDNGNVLQADAYFYRREYNHEMHYKLMCRAQEKKQWYDFDTGTKEWIITQRTMEKDIHPQIDTFWKQSTDESAIQLELETEIQFLAPGSAEFSFLPQEFHAQCCTVNGDEVLFQSAAGNIRLTNSLMERVPATPTIAANRIQIAKTSPAYQLLAVLAEYIAQVTISYPLGIMPEREMEQLNQTVLMPAGFLMTIHRYNLFPHFYRDNSIVPVQEVVETLLMQK